jgi:hypothetical protein
MCVRLWKWAVVEGACDGAVGVSMTCHGAMEALSRALVASQALALGKVVQIALVDGVWEPLYLWNGPERVAECREGVIRWKSVGEDQ